MESTRINHQGVYACSVTKHRSWSGHTYYEISFPPEETYQVVIKDTVQEVHSWLDAWYGAGEWVAV